MALERRDGQVSAGVLVMVYEMGKCNTEFRFRVRVGRCLSSIIVVLVQAQIISCLRPDWLGPSRG